MSKKLLYIGNIGINGTSLAVHAQNMARLFQNIGYEVTMLCDSGNERYYFPKEIEGLRYCYCKKYCKASSFSSVENVLDEIAGWKFLYCLWRQIRTKKPDLVVYYGNAGEAAILSLCHKAGIPVVLERVDWFEKADRDRKAAVLLQKYTDWTMTHTDKKADGVIAISRYLAEHYEKMGKCVLQVPPIFRFSVEKEIVRTKHAGELHLVYAGSLGGNKDTILPVLSAVRKINQGYLRISMDIVGTSVEELEVLTGESQWEHFGVRAIDRCENEKAREIVEKADFSILLRQNKRYAKAGFSTKFAESMTLGVPVICTRVGGADSIIQEWIDGVLLENNEVETICKVLERLLAKESEEILKMKQEAYHTACKNFHISKYLEPMRQFLEQVEGSVAKYSFQTKTKN